MAFKVDQFISHFDSHAGFARSSKFEVRIALPSSLYRLNGGTTEELALQCEAAELPGYNINVVEQKIFGAPTYIAGTPSFGDISLTFICAGDFWEKKFFDAWLDLIIPKSTYLTNYKEQYQTAITIHQYSDFANESAIEPGLTNRSINISENPPSKLNDNLLNNSISKLGTTAQRDTPSSQISPNFKPTEVFSCKLINAFPVTVNALPLNWGNDEIHRLTVVFKYDKWLNTQMNASTNLPPTERIPGTDSANQRNARGVIIPQATSR